jgi:hypothetical protein
MSEHAADLEGMLRQALRPIEPPEAFAQRVEHTLTSLTELAAEELDSWELRAMRDPRNWVRPAAAAVVGVTAGTALVALRVRARHRTRRQQSRSLVELAARTINDIADEARRILPD